jgi:hypothetical protein
MEAPRGSTRVYTPLPLASVLPLPIGHGRLDGLRVGCS